MLVLWGHREREREREGPEAGKAARSISAFVVTVHTASWLVSEGGATGVSLRGVELFAGARIWSSEAVLVQDSETGRNMTRVIMGSAGCSKAAPDTESG